MEELSKEIILNYITKVTSDLGKELSDENIKIQNMGNPHGHIRLKDGETAVYLFYLEEEKCYLKIGKVGTNSNARLNSQHYSIKASQSTLASSLLNDKYMVKKYSLQENTISAWINEKTSKTIIIIRSKNEFANSLVESMLHYKCNPKYEGKNKNGKLSQKQ